MRTLWLSSFIVFAVLISGPFLSLSQAQSLPTAFNFSGQLTDVSGSPVTSSSVTFKLQIYNPTQSCLLYEETETLNLSSTNGKFAIQVGSPTGSASRTVNDPNLSMSDIFRNSGGTILGCYTPAAQDVRQLVVTVVDIGGTPVSDVLSAAPIRAVPYAMVADSLQGKAPSDFIGVSAANNLTQSNVQNIFNNYSTLLSLINGTSSLYVTRQGNGAVGLPSYTGAPSTPVEGQMWYDTTADVLKFQTGSSTISLSGSSGVTSVTAGAGLNGGVITGTGTISMPNVGTSGTYTKVTTDAQGRVSAGAALAEADIPTLSSAGKVSGSAINSGTISGATAINISGAITTSGAVSAVSVLATDVKGLTLQAFDNDTNKVTIKTIPNLASDLNFILPSTNGSNGQVLTTDGSGTLSWSSPAGGSTVTNSASLNNGKIWLGDGANIAQEHTMSGDATISNTGVLSLASVSVSTGKIASNAVTFQKFQQINSGKILGRSTAGLGNIEDLSLGAGLNISGGTLSLTDSVDDDSLSALPCGNGFMPYKSSGTWTCTEARPDLTNSTLVMRSSIGHFEGNQITANSFRLNNSGSFVSINSPAGANYTLALPFDDGTAPGQALVTDGFGTLSWVNVGDFKSDGSVVMSGAIKSLASGPATPSYSFSSDSDTGVYSNTPNTLGFSTGGSTQLFIDSTSNIGVGITSPSTKLHVNGTLRVGDGGETCSSSIAGSIRYFASNMQFCDGFSWSNLAAGGAAITGLTGDVTASGTGLVAATISNNAVTFAKMQQMSADRLLGRRPGSAGSIEELQLVTPLELTGANIELTPCASGETYLYIAGSWTCVLATETLSNSALIRRDASGSFESYQAILNSVKLKNGASDVTMYSPAGANYSITWPNSSGAASQVLTTNGAGILSWANAVLTDGSMPMSGPLRALDGTISSPSYTFTTDTDVGMYKPAVNELGFVTNGLEVLRIQSTSGGRVGIGTTAPSEKFTLSGDGLSANMLSENYMNALTANSLQFRKARGTQSAPSNVFNSDSLGTMSFVGYGGGSWLSAAAIKASVGTGTVSNTSMPGLLTFATTPNGSSISSERMRIDQDGRVGIGTTNPTGLLHVEAFANAAAGLPIFIRAQGSTASSGGNLNLDAGSATAGSGAGGSVSINAGSATTGLGGNVTISAGSATGTGGNVTISGGTGASIGKIQLGSNGTPFARMGACQASIPLSVGSWNSFACSNIPNSAAAPAVSCSSYNLAPGQSISCRASATAGNVECTATTTVTSGTVSCLWMVP